MQIGCGKIGLHNLNPIKVGGIAHGPFIKMTVYTNIHRDVHVGCRLLHVGMYSLQSLRDEEHAHTLAAVRECPKAAYVAKVRMEMSTGVVAQK